MGFDKRAERTWGAHGSSNLDVDEFHGCDVLEVVPGPVVMQLSQQLNGRLGTIRLQDRHVEVIHKHNLQACSGQAVVRRWLVSAQAMVSGHNHCHERFTSI